MALLRWSLKASGSTASLSPSSPGAVVKRTGTFQAGLAVKRQALDGPARHHVDCHIVRHEERPGFHLRHRQWDRLQLELQLALARGAYGPAEGAAVLLAWAALLQLLQELALAVRAAAG
jgi:hypothetical protein